MSSLAFDPLLCGQCLYLLCSIFRPFRTLLVPVDGSGEAAAAFDYAVRNTTKEDTLLLFHGEAQVFHLTGSGGMVVVVEPDQTASKNSNTLKNNFLERCTLLNALLSLSFPLLPCAMVISFIAQMRMGNKEFRWGKQRSGHGYRKDRD